MGTPTVRISFDKSFAVVERMDGDVVKDRDRLNPSAKSKRAQIARTIGVDDGTLIAWLDEAKDKTAKGQTVPHVFTIPTQRSAGGDVIVRRLDQRDDQAEASYPLEPVTILKEVIPNTPVDRLVKWADAGALCCLDVDYHERKHPPHESWLRVRVVADLAPRPFAWHFSRGGGLHLFYVREGAFNADELASVAALAWRAIDPSAQVELKTGVRGAGDKETFFAPGDVQDTSSTLRGWTERTDQDDAARDEWLAQNEVEVGRRYGHTKCPINPTPGYESKGDPVHVMEGGVYCHRCQGEGRSLGCRKPGFAPFAAITGGTGATDLGSMIREITHWGHARYVLTRKYGMPEVLAEKAYRAALKAYHHGSSREPLIPLAFDRDTQHFTRVGDTWVNLEDNEPWENERKINATCSLLPAVNALDDKGQPKAKAGTVAVFTQPHDLAHRGLPEIDRIHGFRLTKPFLSHLSSAAVVETFPKELRKAGDGRFLPQYVPGSRRMDVEKAWQLLEEALPGLDRQLLSLTICAIATAQETRLGTHPRLFVTGVSGSAKTTMPKIAAAIIGAKASDCAFNASSGDRFRQHIGQTNRENGLVLFNEIIKDTERAAGPKRAVPITVPFDPFLTVSPEDHYHVLNVGARRFGRLSAFVFTEPSLPLALRDEFQIARRMWYWRVKGFKEWDKTLPAAGITNVQMIRATSPNHAAACDAIMSAIIDQYFVQPTSWEALATAHGCEKISESADFEDATPWMRRLFKLVCAAPDITGTNASRWPRFKKIEREPATVQGQPAPDSDPLTVVYNMFADGRGVAWYSSRRLQERDWRPVLGLKNDDDVRFDMANDGHSLYVRFSVGPRQRPVKVNHEIVDPSTWEDEL